MKDIGHFYWSNIYEQNIWETYKDGEGRGNKPIKNYAIINEKETRYNIWLTSREPEAKYKETLPDMEYLGEGTYSRSEEYPDGL
ncbi:MAG: hypothetical protein H7836_04820 [Magnetococcus sp. YQC-3]